MNIDRVAKWFRGTLRTITGTCFARAAGLAVAMVIAVPQAMAAVTSVTPLTWNVIGLDSNSPTTGPYRFPVGARVCSDTGSVTIPVTFHWDTGGTESTDTNIYLRSGSLVTANLTFASAGCLDAYFEVEVNRATAPYDKTRRYYITAGGVSTPTPRELYVEHLISQNRNGITDIKLNGAAVPAGGSMTLMVGNTYNITLDGYTATQGYNQLESFISLSNTIFQVQSVSTTYTSNQRPVPLDRLYADSCGWENNPGSPNYRSCVVGDYKAGGTVSVTYTVKIISGAGTSETLSSLLYDFSGSSYHYNADNSVGARFVNIVGPASVTISKAFSPKAIAPAGTSTMTFKLSNPTTETFTGVNFADTLSGGLKVKDSTVSYSSGCGAGAFSPALAANDTSLSFSGGTLLPNSICTITVNVTAPAGDYPNTTGHLFINTSTDTGNTGSDTLTVSSGPSCIPGRTIAEWLVPISATNPPDSGSGSPTNGSGTAAGNGSGVSFGIDAAGYGAVGAWEGAKFPASEDTAKNLNFTLNTSSYSNINWSFHAGRSNAASAGTYKLYYKPSGGSLTLIGGPYTFTNTDTMNTYSVDLPSGVVSTSTIFYVVPYGSTNQGMDNQFALDAIKFTGCGAPAPAPTITKSFKNSAGTADVTAIQKGATSVLRFSIANTAAGNQALTGIAFSDVLPTGLSIATTSASQCAGTLTTTAATRTIALTGGSLAANGSCTFDVTVTGTTEGQYDNVTGFISSTQSGTSTNYATDSLTVIAPPVLAKSFSPTSIYTSGTPTTSILTFTVNNPNLGSSLSGIGFTDTLPGGLTVASSGPTATCNGGSLSTTTPSSVSFSGGSLAANSSCTFNVTVTGATAGTKDNTTSAVTSAEGGSGNTASASLVVADRTASIDLTKQVSANCHESRPTPRMMKETRGWRCYGRCRENSLGACIPIANLARPH